MPFTSLIDCAVTDLPPPSVVDENKKLSDGVNSFVYIEDQYLKMLLRKKYMDTFLMLFLILYHIPVSIWSI